MKQKLTFSWNSLPFSMIWSDQISRSVVSYSLRPHESQHARPPCPSPTPGVHWDSRPLSQWCHPAISSSIVPFSIGNLISGSSAFSKRRQINKVSCSLPGQGTLASCPCQEETRDKRVLVSAFGYGSSMGKLAPEYPQVIRMWVARQRISTKVAICYRTGDPFQGPRLGFCLTLGNQLFEETHVLTMQEALLGKGAWVESIREKESKIVLPYYQIQT